MKRFQAIEFEDYSWFPTILRNYMTDVYHFNMIKFRLYNCIAPLIRKGMQKSSERELIDLCSGGSGPLAQIQEEISTRQDYPITVTLSDKYPNIPAFKRMQAECDGKINFINESVDVCDVPDNINGFRTIFSAFHHFTPRMAVSILQDTVNKKKSIGIFELSNRTPGAFLQVMLGGPVGQFFMAPFIKPFSWLRLLLTYIPVIPILCIWDGTGSNLRAYSPKEMEELVKRVTNSETYDWQIGIKKGEMAGIKITYIIGTPK